MVVQCDQLEMSSKNEAVPQQIYATGLAGAEAKSYLQPLPEGGSLHSQAGQ